MGTSFVTLGDGARLFVTASGSGRDLVLVSGLGGTAAFWEPLVPRLEPHFRVIRFDQRGIGKSARGTHAVSIATLAHDTLGVLEHMDCSHAILIGHSTGGVILQELALRDASRVGGLVLSGTWARPNRYMTELFRSRAELLKVAPREYAAMGAFVGYTPAWLDANWAKYEAILTSAPVTPEAQAIVAQRIAALLVFDRSSEIASIGLPTFIQGAEDDLIVPAFLQRELAELMPQAELQILSRGGHFFPITRAPRFEEMLLSWAEANDLIS